MKKIIPFILIAFIMASCSTIKVTEDKKAVVIGDHKYFGGNQYRIDQRSAAKEKKKIELLQIANAKN